MSDAVDKRLRAVYDAFDQRNHKGAIKLCNAGIQKYPDCFTFKSLKAVALDRCGKRDEALQLADEVLAAAPPDDHVLNMLLLVLKPANRVQDVTAAYESACNKQPNNEDLLQGLFACHVRSSSYTAQQQVAMKLNKLRPSELYQWWVVSSLALQAHAAAVQARLQTPANSSPAADASGGSNGTSSGNSSSSSGQAPPPSAAAALGADKLLALAEAMAGRLLSKAPAQGGHHSWESVMLYLGLLQAQGKYDAALAAVRGPLGASFSLSAERREAEAALLLAQGDLQSAAQLYQQALQDQPDDWAVLLLYLDCLLPATASTLPACCSTAVAQMVTGVEASTRPGCQTGGLAALLAAMNIGGDSAPPLQERVQQASAFISSLAGSTAGNGSWSSAEQPSSDNSSSNSSGGAGGSSQSVLRGPALAHVELAKRKLQLGLDGEQQLVDALLEYHDRFGHVVSCAMDVFCYLEALGSSSRQQLSGALADRAQQATQQFKQLQEQAGSQQPGDNSSSNDKALLKLLRRQMSARQIQADIGAPSFSDPAAAAAHAQELLQLYAAALPLHQGLDERERGPADELLWQAAATLVAAAALQQNSSSGSSDGSTTSSSTSSIKYLLQAVLVLEAAAKGRPYCAPVRLGLTGLYGLLGNAAGAAHHLTVMDVKHVQHDTLSSHHLLPLLLGLKADKELAALLVPTCALFEDHLVDAGDTLMQAYRNGTHTKVLEFICFKERLERSHTFVLARAERAILSLTTAAAGAGAEPGSAAAAAVAAAVKALPLSQLDSINWRGMRFNDDFTTRLPWLPPIDGPRHMAVLLWWQQQQQQHLQADGGSSSNNDEASSTAVCWWRQVAAAEADVPAAAALRDSMKAAAQQRWLLPHLLHASLDAASSNVQGSAQLPQLLPLLAAAVGFDSLAELDDSLDAAFGQPAKQAAAPGSCSSELGLPRHLQLLDAALFTLASSLQELVVGTPVDQQPQATNGCSQQASRLPQCAARLSAGLQGMQEHMQQLLQPDAAYLGCVLPGHALSAAALLLSETCSWLVLCLEAWSKSLKQARKKKSGKTPASSTPAAEQAAQDAAVQALTQAQQAAHALFKSLQEGLKPHGFGDAASLLAEFDDSSHAVIKALVGWEPRLSVQLVLSDLVKQQRALQTHLQDLSGKLCSRVKSISW